MSKSKMLKFLSKLSIWHLPNVISVSSSLGQIYKALINFQSSFPKCMVMMICLLKWNSFLERQERLWTTVSDNIKFIKTGLRIIDNYNCLDVITQKSILKFILFQIQIYDTQCFIILRRVYFCKEGPMSRKYMQSNNPSGCYLKTLPDL